MPKRWSKLKSKTEALFVDGLRLHIQCSEIRTTWNNDGSLVEVLGTFTVRLEKELIWNFPKQFVSYWTEYPNGGNHYSYGVSDINNLLRDYLDTPKAELPDKKFVTDYFGITEILKCADRRLGLKALERHFKGSEKQFTHTVLEARRALTNQSSSPAKAAGRTR